MARGASDKRRNEENRAKPANENAGMARRARRSSLSQPVAPLFSAPVETRLRLARPVLREVRERVAHGARLLDALVRVDGNLLAREFARWALGAALIPGLALEAVHLYGDTSLALWVVDRALRNCTEVPRPRGGGWRVTH